MNDNMGMGDEAEAEAEAERAESYDSSYTRECRNRHNQECWGYAVARAAGRRVAELEATLRREWWINHCHDFTALYGSDGEMQCVMCPADFKRQPIEELRVLVERSRLAAAREAYLARRAPEL